MTKIGKLTTFWRLLDKESVIVIPKVQRDYAYGREDGKVKEVLNGLLNTMLDAVSNDSEVVLDFVYGGHHIKKGRGSGFEPLDGQQRLTTLFLLYYYASIIQESVSKEDIEPLKKFRYETRQTATAFCESLVGDIWNEVKEGYGKDKKIKELIKDSPKYLPNYETDPTIFSILNVLEVIEGKCIERCIEDLWTKLTMNDNIRFYSLSLEKFGLTDDLYIKMNSRGKKLTGFEIFKADLEKIVNSISPVKKDSLSKKIDNEWMDVLWTYANNCETDDVVRKADEGFMHLFDNIFRLELFRRGIETKNDRHIKDISEIVSDEESLDRIIDILDTIQKTQETWGIAEYWYNYFYFSESLCGNSEKIRLFWQLKRSQKPVFHLAMDGDLSVPELIYFYAIYLLVSQDKDFDVTFRCLRIIRNLVTANVRANSVRYDSLHGFLEDIEDIIINDGNITRDKHEFVAIPEEQYKVKQFCKEDYYKLLEYENHRFLQGSVMLFVDKYYGDQYADTTVLFDQLSHFATIFSDGYDFNKVRIALLDKDVEYMQYEYYMTKDYSMTRRYFVHNDRDWLQFFIKNRNRHNQEAILEVLEKVIPSSDIFNNPQEKCKEFDITSWQYYMAKYGSANREDTKYGCYAWDDKEERPLEIVILNSSQHSDMNLEWKMLNHILVDEMWDNNVNYSLDPHASSPFVLNKYSISLTITQSGWKVRCDDLNMINTLKRNDHYSINPTGISDEWNYYLFDFKKQQNDMDYIDLAKIIIKDIEYYYSSQPIVAM